MSIKRLLYILPIISILALVGCGDKQKKEESKHNNVSENEAPKIEVIHNDNAHATKVKEKKKTKLQVKDGKAYYYDYNVNSEYNSNAQPANEDAAVREKPRTVLDANMHIRSPYERVQISLIVKQLSRDFKIKCSACHDDYANGVVGPSLLGKDSSFIYQAINDFKSGKKSNPLMDDLINMMSDDEIKKIANEIYKFNKEIEKLGARE